MEPDGTWWNLENRKQQTAVSLKKRRDESRKSLAWHSIGGCHVTSRLPWVVASAESRQKVSGPSWTAASKIWPKVWINTVACNRALGVFRKLTWDDQETTMGSNRAPVFSNQIWGFYLHKKSKHVHSSALVLQTFLDDEDDEVVTRKFAFAHRQEPSLTWEVALLVAGGFKCFLFTIETGLIILNHEQIFHILLKESQQLSGLKLIQQELWSKILADALEAEMIPFSKPRRPDVCWLKSSSGLRSSPTSWL